MSLINCPECNKEISDKAVSCPNCGFPIQEQVSKLKSSSTTDICPKCGEIFGNGEECRYCGTKLINCHIDYDDYCKMNIIESWEFKQELYNKYVIDSPEFDEILFSKTYKEEKDMFEAYQNALTRKKEEPKVECPYCHSTNTKKISSMAKVTNVALFGIFGQKRKHQWHCEKCGSDF